MKILTIFDLQNTLIQARLQGKWGKNLLTADVFHDGVSITIPQGKTNEAQKSLSDILGSIFIPREIDHENIGSVRLNNNILLPVFYDEEEIDTELQPFSLRPLLRDIALLPETVKKETINPAILNTLTHDDDPKITAFFSFKGGVGRTLHLTAFAHRLTKTLKSEFSSPKILLIDADIEAPGITWWTRDIFPDPQYSFLDLMSDALFDITNAARTAAQNIQSLRMPFGNASNTCYFLPLFRDGVQLFRPPVLPERLVLSGENPWIMGDLLFALGKELKVDHILVDLRAGLTELSSPLFIDPRLNRVLVSTTSKQSIEGTQLALQQLANVAKLFFPEQAPYMDNTQVLLGFIPPDPDRNRIDTISSQFEEILQQLVPGDPETGSLDLPSWIIESEYDQSLLGLNDFSEALEVMNKSQTIQKACSILLSKFAVQSIDSNTDTLKGETSLRTGAVKKLADYINKLIYAENQKETDFLVTNAYRGLASSFLQQIPNAVVMGAKGSGKTFLFKALADIGQWKIFCERCGLPAACDASIIPLLWSTNFSEENNARTSLFLKQKQKINIFNNKWDHTSGKVLEDELKDTFGDPYQKKKDSEWKESWFRYFCMIFGVKPPDGESWEHVFKKAATALDKPVILLFDGLEDLFLQWISRRDEEGIPPLRILLQDIIRDMSSLSENKVGILLLVRKDIVQRAISQNFGQFASRYSKYELRWSTDEALRLVGWVLEKCGLSQYRRNADTGEECSEKEWEAADFTSMWKALRLFWGMKLGNDASKEAYTVNWIFSAISDFKGAIQARDILRLLFESARAQKNKPFFPGRLLSPTVLRNALKACGEEKIKEIKQEIGSLTSDLDTLRTRLPQVPLTQEIIEELEIKNIPVFEEFGLVFRDGTDYYLPEIYRQGLNLPLKRGARPKVVLLMRQALSKVGITA